MGSRIQISINHYTHAFVSTNTVYRSAFFPQITIYFFHTNYRCSKAEPRKDSWPPQDTIKCILLILNLPKRAKSTAKLISKHSNIHIQYLKWPRLSRFHQRNLLMKQRRLRHSPNSNSHIQSRPAHDKHELFTWKKGVQTMPNPAARQLIQAIILISTHCLKNEKSQLPPHFQSTRVFTFIFPALGRSNVSRRAGASAPSLQQNKRTEQNQHGPRKSNNIKREQRRRVFRFQSEAQARRPFLPEQFYRSRHAR